METKTVTQNDDNHHQQHSQQLKGQITFYY